MKKRCAWAGTDPLYVAYHDEEWGVPVRDDGRLFEFLLLESAQAGLSWLTILKRRAHYRQAFDGFDPVKVARYGPSDIETLLGNAGIIRNRKKIESAVRNARAFLEIQAAFGTFGGYLWRFVDGRPVVNTFRSEADVPPETEASRRLSKDMRQRGVTFFGPVIAYAFMQAVGMVNDHVVDCHRYHEVQL